MLLCPWTPHTVCAECLRELRLRAPLFRQTKGSSRCEDASQTATCRVWRGAGPDALQRQQEGCGGVRLHWRRCRVRVLCERCVVRDGAADLLTAETLHRGLEAAGQLAPEGPQLPSHVPARNAQLSELLQTAPPSR